MEHRGVTAATQAARHDERKARLLTVGWVDTLINEIPAASHYRLELEGMEKENASLKTENERLRAELESLRSKTDTPGRLNDEMEKMLVFILQQEYASVSLMSQTLTFKKEVVAMYIDDLVKSGFIESSYAGGVSAEYYLKQKAKRYLHDVGLL